MSRTHLLSILSLAALFGAVFYAYAADESLTDILDRPEMSASGMPIYYLPSASLLPTNQTIAPVPVVIPTTPTIPVVPAPVTPTMPLIEEMPPDFFTASAVATVACDSIRQVTKSGVTNSTVRVIQDELRAQGYFNQASTGYFGSITMQAVKKFQSAYGIRTTGLVGQLTTSALIKQCRARQNGSAQQVAGTQGGIQTPTTPPVSPTTPSNHYVQIFVPQTTTPGTPASPTVPTTPPAQTPTVPTTPTQPTFVLPSQAQLAMAEQFGISATRAIQPASICVAGPLVGDVEPQIGDRDIDIWDLLQVTTNYDKTAEQSSNPRADINNDRMVNFSDLVIIVQGFGTKLCN